MPINLLAICVGNTRTRVGTFVDDQLVDSHALVNTNIQLLDAQIRESFRSIAGRRSPAVMLASTCRPVGERVSDVLRQLGSKVVVVEKDMNIPIGRQLDPEAIVGDDRLLNAAAAYDTLHQSCVVVDAGTAITVDYVDATGIFHGGAIGPGSHMMLKALSQQTWQLPEIDRLEHPAEPIGHNTIEAMRCGVFHALRGMVRELTEQYANIAGSYPAVVATGGDAELLFKDYELVEHIVDNLTLLGMKLTLEGAKESRND